MKFIRSFLVFITCLFSFSLFAQKQDPAQRVVLEKISNIRDTALMRVKIYVSDTLRQDLYALAVPTCKISYGFTLGKWQTLKRYSAVLVLIPNGPYIQHYGDNIRNRVFDHGQMLSENWNSAETASKLYMDYLLHDLKRACKKAEKRYNPVIFE